MREFKGNSLLEFTSNFVSIDIETTGLDPKYDEIIELSAIRYRNFKEAEKYQTLVKPSEEISDFITELTGISNEMVENAPNIKEALPEFIKFIGQDVVLGHNSNFDINFIYDNCELIGLPRFSNDFIDNMRLCRRLLPGLNHHRLKDMKEHFGITTEKEHRAEDDARATATIFIELKALADNTPDWNKYKKASYFKAKDITTEKAEFDEDHPLFGKVCVFTGTLSRMTRKEAMQIVVDVGGINGDGVTAKTNYLVLGNTDYRKVGADGKSSKQRKAEALKLKGNDIEIISENVFFSLLDD